MSIVLVTGVPGGGKSYFAAEKLLEVYKKKNRQIYTNVNLKISYNDYIKPLSIPDLYEFATKELALFHQFEKLSEEYKETIENETIDITLKDESINEDKKATDNEFAKYYGNYDKYLKDSGLLEYFGGCFIVWDECQNDLQAEPGKIDAVWLRFFSYHRHFNIDMILLTQDASLIPKRYRAFVSRYYFAQNPAKRLISTTLRFKVYTDLRQFEKYFVEAFSIKMNDEVHAFYDSGEKNLENSVFLKKILPAFAIFIALGLFYYFVFYSKVEDEKKAAALDHTHDINTSKQHINKVVNDDDEIPDLESQHLLRFRCNLNKCTLENSSFVIPIEQLTSFCEVTDSNILFTNELNDYLSDVVVMVNESIYNDLNTFILSSKGDKHDKSGDTFNNPFNHN